MRKLMILVLVMVAGNLWAFGFNSSGGGVKRYNITVNKVEIKGPAWSAQSVYSSTTTRQHAATYAGSTWVALVNNTNQTPSDGSTYWAKYIAKGDTGATGPKGDTGSISAASALNFTQRQNSSAMMSLMQKGSVGTNSATITVDDNLTTSPVVKITDTGITHNGVALGTGSGGSAGFNTITRSIQTNMSSGRLYAPGAFAKHNLPAAAGSQSVRVFANTTSAQVSVNTESGVIIDFGGITSTAGYSVRVPVGSVYEFFSTAADSTWYAIKQAGSAITEYVQAFVAALGWDLSSKDFGSISTGTEVYQKFILTNSGNATSASQSVTFVNQSSCFRPYSSTCGSSLAAGANCTIGVAFKPAAAGTWGGTKLRATATGIGPYDIDLLGTGATGTAYIGWSNTNGTPTGTPASSATLGDDVTITAPWTASTSGIADSIQFYAGSGWAADNTWVCLYKNISGTITLIGKGVVSSTSINSWHSKVTLVAESGQSLSFANGDVLYYGVAFYDAAGSSSTVGREDAGGPGMYYNATANSTVSGPPATLTWTTSASRLMAFILEYH